MSEKKKSQPDLKPGRHTTLQDELNEVSERLFAEVDLVIEQVEGAVRALQHCDRDLAMQVRRSDTRVDREEVDIEEACLRILALHKPVAVDLRKVALILKVNEDLERIADHAGGVAKAVNYLGEREFPVWPPALVEMSSLIAPVCRRMKHALTDESRGESRELIKGDSELNKLARRVFEELEQLMGEDKISERAGLLAYRASRDIERIGDLCVDIAEDIIYLRTGEIVRHAKKRGVEV